MRNKWRGSLWGVGVSQHFLFSLNKQVKWLHKCVYFCSNKVDVLKLHEKNSKRGKIAFLKLFHESLDDKNILLCYICRSLKPLL